MGKSINRVFLCDDRAYHRRVEEYPKKKVRSAFGYCSNKQCEKVSGAYKAMSYHLTCGVQHSLPKLYLPMQCKEGRKNLFIEVEIR